MELSLDTVSQRASVALSERGELLTELTWLCRANHSAEVLPAIDQLLTMSDTSRSDLSLIMVCRGPGSYGGLRAGLSLAMALAFALGIDVLGVGRLEVDAFQHSTFPGPICAIHRAGRGELAWAAYRVEGRDLRELVQPQLCWPDELPDRAPSEALFCGEVDKELAGLLRGHAPEVRIASGSASVRRAGALAELGWQRYQAGERADHGFIEPLYLREPQITEAKPRL